MFECRLQSVIDLPAADAQYHQACSVNCMNSRPMPRKYNISRDTSNQFTSTGRPQVNKPRKKMSSLTITFNESSPVIIGKASLLSNNDNKQRFVDMLGKHLELAGYNVLHAENDADTLIVKTALTLSQEKSVTVVADDTDILILLLYHAQGNIALQASRESDKTHEIRVIQNVLDATNCRNLLFMHALTGWDTTSAFLIKVNLHVLKHYLNHLTLPSVYVWFQSEQQHRGVSQYEGCGFFVWRRSTKRHFE